MPERYSVPVRIYMGEPSMPYDVTSDETSSLDSTILHPAGEATGTFDGKPIALKHFHLVLPYGQDELYADSDNQLMQVTFATSNLHCIRNNFVLTANSSFSASQPINPPAIDTGNTTGTNDFTLIKNGKPIGDAAYSIEATKDGYHIKAHSNHSYLHDAKADGSKPAFTTNSQFTSDFAVDLNGDTVTGNIKDTGTKIMTNYVPDHNRSHIAVTVIQSGTSVSAITIPVTSPSFLVAPNYDPSALQILLTTALAHPHLDGKYTFIVPGTATSQTVGSGSTDVSPVLGGMTAKQHAYPTNVVDVSLQLADEVSGTLDGKPIALKHFVLTYSSSKADLYGDATGRLMQAHLEKLGVNYIRNNFVLSHK